jgi:hypothetical protein
VNGVGSSGGEMGVSAGEPTLEGCSVIIEPLMPPSLWQYLTRAVDQHSQGGKGWIGRGRGNCTGSGCAYQESCYDRRNNGAEGESIIGGETRAGGRWRDAGGTLGSGDKRERCV